MSTEYDGTTYTHLELSSFRYLSDPPFTTLPTVATRFVSPAIVTLATTPVEKPRTSSFSEASASELKLIHGSSTIFVSHHFLGSPSNASSLSETRTGWPSNST